MIYDSKIKYLRERNNIKQKDIVQLLIISKSLYSEYEQEIKTIPTKYLNTICNYFSVSFDYIFNFSEKTYYDFSNLKIDFEIVGNRLKQFRKENKMSQQALAKKVGCCISTISSYENGINIISVPVIYRVCKKYHISADYLLGKIDNPKYLK